MQSQYPGTRKVPLKDLPHTTKLRTNPRVIIRTAPPPEAGRWTPQYPYLPPEYPKEVGDLGTNLVKHIYQVGPVTSPWGWSIRRPSQMTTLQPVAGLYEGWGPRESEKSFLGNGGRSINLTGSKPQVRVYETRSRGEFYSPNPERGFYVWEDLGLT